MPPLRPGFYVATAPCASDLAAVDLVGPFPCLWDLSAWLVDFKVNYMPWRRRARRCVQYWGEMTGEEAGGMWATAVSAVRESAAPPAARILPGGMES